MDYNPFSLKGKVVLITGASSGIGREIAIHTAKSGANIILTGRNSKRLDETVSMLGSDKHKTIAADLSTNDGINQLVKELPPLDGIVHSAGISKRLPLKFISEKSLNELMQINFTAPALLTREIYKHKLFRNEASIVFISSVGSSYASLGSIMYMSSKGAMNSFMKGVAFELASSGIRANAIQPGMIKTNLTTAIPDEEIQKDIQHYPLGRYGKPEEVAFAAIYLLSNATKWMTGSIITLDGGLTLQ